MKRALIALIGSGCLLTGCPVVAPTDTLDALRGADINLEGPRLGAERTTQEQITDGSLTLKQIRERGMRVFTTPFNSDDGYGDGPMNPDDPISPGGRPTLQGNGVFLRVNGLDGQTCLECHSIISNATVPATFGIGGVGGSVTNAIVKPFVIDVADEAEAGIASFSGRFINPPFLFGSGGVELVGKEMTAELQALDRQARESDGEWVALQTKGVSFGMVRYVDGEIDASRLEGVDEDLVVKPFGRKGDFPTVRAFDVDAMMFHFGMQPTEAVGVDTDADGDGVMNEVLTGEISALHIFNVTLERPVTEPGSAAAGRGAALFSEVGCAGCHVPFLDAERSSLPLTFPEDPRHPFANVFFEVDLTADAPGFDRNANGGVRVPLFSDLKRHDMGPELAESSGGTLDPFFITPRLWGIADTGPYLHDGRAMTISDAVLMHGGEAQSVRDRFAGLSEAERADLLAYLWTLRTPLTPAAGLGL